MTVTFLAAADGPGRPGRRFPAVPLCGRGATAAPSEYDLAEQQLLDEYAPSSGCDGYAVLLRARSRTTGSKS